MRNLIAVALLLTSMSVHSQVCVTKENGQTVIRNVGCPSSAEVIKSPQQAQPAAAAAQPARPNFQDPWGLGNLVYELNIAASKLSPEQRAAYLARVQRQQENRQLADDIADRIRRRF